MTPQETPRTRKRHREAAQALAALAEVAEGSGSSENEGSEGGDEDKADSTVEAISIEERIEEQRYETNWKLLDHRTKVVKTYAELFDGRDNVYDKVHYWALPEAERRSLIVSRITFTVSGKGQPKIDHWTCDIEDRFQYEDKVRLRALTCKAAHGYKQVRMDIVAVLEEKEVAPTATSAVSTSDNRRRKKRLRLTATQQQELNTDDAAEDAVAAVDYSLPLRVRRVCGVTSCPNNQCTNGGYCYWITSNSKEGHFPLNTSAVKAWAQEIKDGHSDENKPSNNVLELLFSAKSRLLSHRHSHRARAENTHPVQGGSGSGHAPVYNNFFGVNPADVLAQQPQQQSAEPPSSAPIETPPLEVLQAFFQYCKDSIAWRGFETDLSAIEVALYANGYDIDAIKGLTAVDWQEMDLKRGQRDKFLNSVKKFKCMRRDSG